MAKAQRRGDRHEKDDLEFIIQAISSLAGCDGAVLGHSGWYRELHFDPLRAYAEIRISKVQGVAADAHGREWRDPLYERDVPCVPWLEPITAYQPSSAMDASRPRRGLDASRSRPIHRRMDGSPLQRKLRVLADAAKYDASCASSGSKREKAGGLGSTEGMGICHSYTPDGRCVSLLKVLLTNYCVYDCSYCVNRRSSDVERASFQPSELVRLTMDFYRRNYIEGLFLSSGVVRSPDDTMERMIEVARALRQVEQFGGYIHLKAVAGASAPLIARAGQYADRVSVNIELPSVADLGKLAPEKRAEQIEGTMQTLDRGISEAREATYSGRVQTFAPAGQSTQMIVGATPSTDRTVLTTAARLYDAYALRRVYYSGYSPIPFGDAILPSKPPPLVREHRLYQADWLLRYYGFSVEEVVPEQRPQLDLEIDPKLAWALQHREWFPVDLRSASREQLLRVPGLGVTNVDRIIELRRHVPVTLDSLRRMRVHLQTVAPFVLTADKNAAPAAHLESATLRQTLHKPSQLNLFDSQESAAVSRADAGSS